MVSTREVSQAGIPEGGKTWQNVHLQYTHGFGAVASQVNTATAEGQPVFTLRDIPPIGAPALEGNGQRVYYGEGAPGDAAFVVVDTGTDELDYQGTATDDQAQADVQLRRRRRHPGRRPVPARPVRLALPRRQPADLGPDHR